MPSYVVFLRAVNVGGRFVKMADLREALTADGFDEVETHIQSGNVKIASSLRSVAKVEAALEATIATCAGFDVPAIVRTPAQLRAVAEEVAGTKPLLAKSARRYVCFVKSPPTGEKKQAAEAWDADGERVKVLHRGDILVELTKPSHEARIGYARLEKLTGTVATMRDLKVVRALDEKWGA